MATDVASVLQGLECSLCFNLLEEPKQLSCSHSFCKKCLQQLHHSQGMPMDLKCPFCRQITRLGTKGLSDLKTNVPLKSMVGDVKTSRKMCTVCDPEAKSPAVYYCQRCDEYMCDACLQAHEKFHKKSSHVVVSVDDIKSGNVKVKLMCHEHPGDERLWVCTSCKVSICFRCRVLYHSGSDHVLHKADDFKKNMKDEIEYLEKKGIEKMGKIKSYTKVVREQSAKVKAIIAKREADINKAFDETVLRLNTKKNALLSQCREKEIKLNEELSKYGKDGDDLITSISSACELVGNGVRALLEGEALVVHSNLCKELHDILGRDDPDESKPKQVTSQAKDVTFTPYRLDDEHILGMLNTSRAEARSFTPCRLDDEHILGTLNINDWKLEKVAEFPTSGKVSDTMTQTKDGKMIVGYRDGGIKEFTVSGPQKTVLKDVKVLRLSVLSDGRYVVRDMNENISLYSSAWDKLDIKEFKMKSTNEHGGMDVDKYDNIYVGYYFNRSINVFTPEGGAPIREIPCHYTPRQIWTMNHSNMLVVSNDSSVRVIDQQGTVKHDVTKEKGYAARPAVLNDESIVIGWKKDDLVSVDLYTNQLKHVRTVISGLECKSWYYALREFSSGEIALLSSTFYVLHKTVLRIT